MPRPKGEANRGHAERAAAAVLAAEDRPPASVWWERTRQAYELYDSHPDEATADAAWRYFELAMSWTVKHTHDELLETASWGPADARHTYFTQRQVEQIVIGQVHYAVTGELLPGPLYLAQPRGPHPGPRPTRRRWSDEQIAEEESKAVAIWHETFGEEPTIDELIPYMRVPRATYKRWRRRRSGGRNK